MKLVKRLIAGLTWRVENLRNKLSHGDYAINLRASAHQHSDSYDAERYWFDRFIHHQTGFRGVGNVGLSESENIEQYTDAVKSLRELLDLISFNPRNKSVLDIGCGNGFWTEIFKTMGVMSYCGLDITDAILPRLRTRNPDFQFKAGRVYELDFGRQFELISMIDVTQHITRDEELTIILNTVRSLLEPCGVFVVTFWNLERVQESAHEVFRPFSFYTERMNDLEHTAPAPFRDKYIAAFYHPGRLVDTERMSEPSREMVLKIAQKISKEAEADK